MATGYIDYLTNNGIIYFPYTRVEALINTDGKPFQEWIDKMNTHNHDIRYAASAHTHSGYLTSIGPNNIRTTASYPDPLNIIADSGGIAEIKLYPTVAKDDVGKMQYKDGKVSIGINNTAWLHLQGDGVYFNEDRLATAKEMITYVEDAVSTAGLDFTVLDQRYASNQHNHMLNEIDNFPTTMPNPTELTIIAGSTSVTYDGSSPKTITINLAELGGMDANYDFDDRYYKLNDVGCSFNTNLTLNRIEIDEDNNELYHISCAKEISNTITSYEFYAKEWTTSVSDIDLGVDGICNGVEELCLFYNTSDNSQIIASRMAVIHDLDGIYKAYVSLEGYQTSEITKTTYPLLMLSGGSKERNIKPRIVVNGDLYVKGKITSTNGVERLDSNIVKINLTTGGWSGSGPYTQTITRPAALLSDYPILVKVLSYDSTTSEYEAYNRVFNIISNGTAQVNQNNLIFKVLKKPTTDITVGLLQ